jgi:hypothetical protein
VVLGFPARGAVLTLLSPPPRGVALGLCERMAALIRLRALPGYKYLDVAWAELIPP